MNTQLDGSMLTFSAMWGRNAERVVRAMAVPITKGYTKREVVRQLGEDEWQCAVTLRDGRTVPFRLVLGRREGIYLHDQPLYSGWSCKPFPPGSDGIVQLPIGSDIPLHRIPGIANNILVCWARGAGWINPGGTVIEQPYGPAPALPRPKRRRRSSRFVRAWGFGRWDRLSGY